jgi:Phenylalanyl-tRNA synthetase beta subunit
VKVPGNRIDIMGEVDVIEDIAKAIGYSSIEASTIPISSSGSENPVNSFADTMRDIFIGAGFQEIVTYVVTSGEVYGGMGAHPDYQIMNPKSLEFSFIRNLLYPGMLDLLRRNTNRSFPQRVFEVGNVISGSIQAMKACIMIIDSHAGYSEIKSNIDAILLRITAQKCTVVPEKIDAAIEGRSGKILINSERIGIVGEIHPEILRKFSLPLPVVFAEFDLSTLSKIYGH